jgi:hypothetical protein
VQAINRSGCVSRILPYQYKLLIRDEVQAWKCVHVGEIDEDAKLIYGPRSFICGSDARIIMGNDDAALVHLWREKRGEAELETCPVT